MGAFIVYPAIDLRFGKVVRLKQGKAEQQTTYSDDPIATSKKWIEQGAEWLHVVNLNGAFGEETKENENAIQNIITASSKSLKIQLGGGIRSVQHVKNALTLGASRVVVGTAAIENPDFGIELLEKFGGEKIAFGFDAIDQTLMTQGWQTSSETSMISLAKKLSASGAETIIYTNIKKDGMQTGVDWKNARSLANVARVSVIASGGVAKLDDIAQVKKSGLAGVIVGRALYEGNFTLQEALNVS